MKTKSIYIASSLRNCERVIKIKEILNKNNIEITYDWASEYIKGNEKEENWSEYARLEIEGIDKADTVLFILPAGRGAHFELGYAYALNKTILLLEDLYKDSVAFYTLPKIKRFNNENLCIEYLLNK